MGIIAHKISSNSVFFTILTFVCMWRIVTMGTFEPSTNIYRDVVIYSNIEVAGCGSQYCNQTCPYRDSFPGYAVGLSSKGDNCSDIPSNFEESLPSSVNPTEKSVHFNSLDSCTDIRSIFSNEGYYSFSFWMKVSCKESATCKILQYANQTLSVDDSSLKLETSDTSRTITTLRDDWLFVVLRYNGKTEVFVNGGSIHQPYIAEQGSSQLCVIGPQKELTGEDYISIIDFRFVSDVLTNREILGLFLNSRLSPELNLEDHCRCPKNAPVALEGRLETLCTNYDKSETVLRVNAGGGYSNFLKDGNNTTKWKSDTLRKTTEILVNLTNVFQVAGLALHGLEPASTDVVLALQYEGQTTQQLEFKNGGCNSPNNCHDLDAITGSVFELDPGSIQSRDDLRPFLADTVQITLKSATSTQFTIAELEFHVRCHCYGNDPNCIVSQANYTCSCASHTDGPNCENCDPQFYREPDQFSCMKPCNCNNDGRVDNNCNQDGGQCTCKSNVNSSASRTCDECDFNSINLGSDDAHGCSQCTCNRDGIQYCATTSTTACVCKDNVDNSTGTCGRCLPRFYGLQLPGGCLLCDCNANGISSGDVNQCDSVTGQCPCKTNVRGRQCNTCKKGLYNLRPDSIIGCEDDCACSFVGSLLTETCDIISGNCSCLEGVKHNRQCSPEIRSVIPTYGPIAGGTVISITGVLFGDGASRLDYYINNQFQIITFRNSTLITVKTSQNSNVTAYSQSLVWSRHNQSYRPEMFDGFMFEYKANPMLESNKAFTTYASGGCRLPVRGNHMNSTHSPRFVVHTYNSGDVFSDCKPISDSEIACTTPDVRKYNQSGKIDFGIIFDGYTFYEQISDSTASLTIIADPVVTWFTENFGNTFDTEIEIKGVRLDAACSADRRVMIGDKECEIISINANSIVCNPKETFPGTSRDEKLVVVFGYLRLEPGAITFKEFWSTTVLIYIIIGVGCALLVVIVIIVICCVQKRRKEKQSKRGSQTFDLIDRAHGERAEPNSYSPGVVNRGMVDMSSNSRDTANIMNSFLERLSTDIRERLKTSVIERSNITPGNKCTKKGDRIRIINGTFSENSGGGNLTIKTLVTPYPKDGEIPDWLQKGLSESLRMRDYVNMNVLRSCGVSIDDKQIYVLYPEMTRRTLKDFLVMASEPFTEEKRLDLCVQVADGMNYLDSHHIVHKDLAARNCWVTDKDVVKISDSSFTTDLYPDEYSNQNGDMVPVRWMAPESLKQIGFYHSKSDVWSFGVVMWEIFTNGYLPYYDITNSNEIPTLVGSQGYKLGKPHDCSNKVFSVIELCHDEQSNDRPNFYLVTNHLTEIISPTIPVSYVNEGELAEDNVYQNTEFTNNTGDGPSLPPRPPRKR